MAAEETFWNGEPCEARQVTLLVAESSFPLFWGREFVGQRRNATEVTYAGEVFYLDDEALADEGDEVGWRKVTLGRGSPHFSHRNLRPEPGSVETRA